MPPISTTPSLTPEELAIARTPGRTLPGITVEDMALLPKSIVRGLLDLGFRPTDGDAAPEAEEAPRQKPSNASRAQLL